MLKYSPSTGGFYASSVHTVIPADAVPITAARHAELMEAQSQGRRIVADVDGQPIAPNLPAPTLADAKLAAVLRIKGKAGEVILFRVPAWKQANLTARALELLSAGDTGLAEWAGIQAQWAWVKSVRMASDQGEAGVLACPDDAGVEMALASALIAIESVE